MTPDEIYLELVEAVGLERGFEYIDTQRDFSYTEATDKTITTLVHAKPGAVEIEHPFAPDEWLSILVDDQCFIERTRNWYHELWERMVELKLTDEDAEHRFEILQQQHVAEPIHPTWVIDKFGRVLMTALIDPIKWERSLPSAYQLSRLSERIDGDSEG